MALPGELSPTLIESPLRVSTTRSSRKGSTNASLADEVIVGGWVEDLRDGSPLEVRISDQFQLFRGTFTRGARVLFEQVLEVAR